MPRPHASADNTLCIGHRNTAEARLDVDNKDDHRECNHGKGKDAEIADRARLEVGVDRADILRQRRDDTGKDDQ